MAGPDTFLVATDVVLFGEVNQVWHVLLIQRKNNPFQNFWALPGGFLEADEDLMAGALRELAEETGVVLQDAIQVGAYGHPLRDPRGRVISIAFTAQVKAVNFTIAAADDARAVKWQPLRLLPPLAFDHQQIITDAQRLVTL